MPNLKDIRRRIKSVKNTQKITQAMRMVAAAKVKRAENKVRAIRPYSEALQHVFADVFTHVSKSPVEGTSRYLDMLVDRPRKNLGILLISADRGLCGSYHSTVMRQALRLEKELIELGLTPKFYLVGNKIIQGFKRYSHSPVLGRMGNMTAAPSHAHAHQIAETLTQAFLSNEIDQIEILSTHFVSMISYKPQLTAVLPVTLDAHSPQPQQRSSEMILSPDPVETLDQLVPMYLTNIIYRQLLEASASEHAARMTAMSNATSNAGEMINKLTIVYNKLRQASITQELLEVVSGAQALQ